MSAPERIWVDDDGYWFDNDPSETRPEYIRKDASDAAIVAARADGVREGMLKAAEIADQHRDPTGTEYGEGWDASARRIAKEVRAAAEAQP